MRRTRITRAAAGLVLACAVGACGGGPSEPGRVDVVAGFYPLQYATERVGGDRVAVTNLAAPGVEPHDLELTPGDVRHLDDADLIVALPGFQPALDDALAQDGRPSLDVSAAARLDQTYTPEPGGGEQATAQPDPHFWLDPLRLADVGDSLATALTERDPDGAASYRANAAALRADLVRLDGEYRVGLARCRSRALVTGHYAFGYLASRYGLEQVAISGLRPESEPSPPELNQITAYVQQHGVRTIYAEVLVNNEVARTVAAETGAKVAVLDPIEGLSEASAARDYPGLMRANLATLRVGQECA